MKSLSLLFLSFGLFCAEAQDATPTPKPRKHLFFLGAAPEATPAPKATTPAPKAATPKAADKPKPAAKPARKATEKPPEKPPELLPEKPADLPTGGFAERPLELGVAKSIEEPPVKVEKPAVKQLSARNTSKNARATELPAASLTPAVVTSTVPPEPAQIVRAFFSMLASGDIDGAYANLMKGSKIAERPEEIRLLKGKTHEAVDVFGSVRGYDLVDSKPVGARLVRATYISLGHDYPLRWRFYFYRSEDEWKLIDIRVDDKLTGIFDEQEEPRPATDAK